MPPISSRSRQYVAQINTCIEISAHVLIGCGGFLDDLSLIGLIKD